MPSPCNVSIPASCAPLRQRVSDLDTAIRRKQEELRRARPADKPQLIVDIQELQEEKGTAETAYVECIKSKPISLRFLGSMSVTFSDPDMRQWDQVSPGVDFVTHFTAERDKLTVYSMADVFSAPYSVQCLGRGTTEVTTVRLQRPFTGAVLPGCHLVMRDILWRFDHSFDLPVLEEDSDLRVTLSTRAATGSAVDAAGNVRLVGGGTFEGGLYLGGKPCVVTLAGTFN